jgi:hypothetical protein
MNALSDVARPLQAFVWVRAMETPQAADMSMLASKSE